LYLHAIWQLIDQRIRAEAMEKEETNPEDAEGWTRLHYASQWGMVERIHDLVHKGAGQLLGYSFGFVFPRRQ
jgi:hypothetical protein